MGDTRSRPNSTRKSTEPQLWLTVRRFDVIELAGAAVVVLLILAVAFVLVREAQSDRPEQDFPPLPFAGPIYSEPVG